jgi:WD40 repeat protein
LNDVYSLKLIEKKKLLLSGSGDQRIGVWSYITGTHILIETITGHLESVCALKYNSRVGFLFSIDSVGVVFKWETHNFTALGKFWDFSGTELDNCFDVSSDGKFIYAPDKDNPCWLRILNTEEKLKQRNDYQPDELLRKDSIYSNDIILKKHTNEIKAVKLIEKLKLIITAGKDNMILLWHLDKHFLVRPPLYNRHYDFVSSMQIIKNTGYLITGGNDKCLNIFDVSSNFNLFNRIKTNCKIRTVRASKDGRFVISGGQNSQTVQIISTKSLISKLKKHEPTKKTFNDSIERSFDSLDHKFLKNASMINNNKYGTHNDENNSEKNKSTKTKELSNFLSIIECSNSKSKSNEFDVDNVISFSIPKEGKLKKSSYINKEFEIMLDEIRKNPNEADFKVIKTNLLRNIEMIKTKLFEKELNNFWKYSVSELKEKDNNKSIFFHDYQKRRKTEDLSTLNLNIKKMFEKLQYEENVNELKLDFHSILRTIESYQIQLTESERKGSFNEHMDIFKLPHIERKVKEVDPETEHQEMLKKCISFLASQIKD